MAQEVTFDCEVVTPMFLGGADQQAELRASAIKGAMRWWFRAAIGGTLFQSAGNNFVESVAKHERVLFGATDGRGLFAIRVHSAALDESKTTLCDFKIGSPNEKGLAYMGYGLYDKKKVNADS